MEDEKQRRISRRGFLKKSSTGLVALGFVGVKPGVCAGSHPPIKKPAPSYRLLGSTGMEVSSVGFGASRTMESMLLKMALDAGVTFIDTGRSYFNGQNEIMVGETIKENRHRLVIQSKISLRLRQDEKNLLSASVSQRIKTEMEWSLAESLKALRTDYIDVMLLHGVRSVDMIRHETIMTFFQEAKKKGQIRAHGFSCHTNQVEVIRAANQTQFYDVIMISYNHKGSYVHSQSGRHSEWDQKSLEGEMKKALAQGTGIVAMKTCSAGPFAPNPNSKPSYEEALRWVLGRGTVHTMAVAMGNLEELEEDVRAMR
jgi:aryl-alcohol dehydrogenase-like predicted oxidoreductase